MIGLQHLGMVFVFHSEHAILRKAKPRLFDWQFIQTGNYGEHRKFAYRETHGIHIYLKDKTML